ncbi:hypothetical protein OAJ83_02205 [Candidatus Nitrosopelagicus sp.]|nr:hypothetical protein [Candidatus Nitrosopelagicus sp.]
MSAEEQLQKMVDQTIEMALMNVEAYYKEIEASKDILKIKDPKEFVFGLIMGQILGLGVAALAQMKGGNPTPQDQMQVRDMAYKRVPQIRERIFDQ